MGLPSTPAELSEYVADPKGRDLLSSQGATVQAYARQIMNPFARASEAWEALGVETIRAATLSSFASAFNDGRNAAVVLVSHWLDGAHPRVELFDGMRNTEDVAQSIPESFDGVLDLCVCHSLDLAQRVKTRLPRCRVKWVNGSATPSVWFHVYALAFRMMSELGLDYLSALDGALREFENGA